MFFRWMFCRLMFCRSTWLDMASRSRGLLCPSFAVVSALIRNKGAGKAGRRLAPEVPRVPQEGARGGRQVGRSPGLPCAMVGTVSFALSPGSDALLPPSPPAFARCADRSAATSPRGLGASYRTPGPHDFSVRAHHRWAPARLACARRVDHAMTLSAPCRTARLAAHGISALQLPRAPTLSRPSHPGPRLVTIAKRPFGGRDGGASTPKQKFCKYEYFATTLLTQRWGVLPDGQHKGSGPGRGHRPYFSQL